MICYNVIGWFRIKDKITLNYMKTYNLFTQKHLYIILLRNNMTNFQCSCLWNQDSNGNYRCLDVKSANEIIGTTTEEVVLKAKQGETEASSTWQIETVCQWVRSKLFLKRLFFFYLTVSTHAMQVLVSYIWLYFIR